MARPHDSAADDAEPGCREADRPNRLPAHRRDVTSGRHGELHRATRARSLRARAQDGLPRQRRPGGRCPPAHRLRTRRASGTTRSWRHPSPRGSGSGGRAGTRTGSAPRPGVSRPRCSDQRLRLENESAFAQRDLAQKRSGIDPEPALAVRQGGRQDGSESSVRGANRHPPERRDGVARCGTKPMAQDESIRGLGVSGEKARQIRWIVLAVPVQGGNRGCPVAERGTEPRPERGALALAARVPENLHGAGPSRDPGAPVRGGVVHHDHGAVRAKPLDDAAERADLVEHGTTAHSLSLMRRPSDPGRRSGAPARCGCRRGRGHGPAPSRAHPPTGSQRTGDRGGSAPKGRGARTLRNPTRRAPLRQHAAPRDPRARRPEGSARSGGHVRLQGPGHEVELARVVLRMTRSGQVRGLDSLGHHAGRGERTADRQRVAPPGRRETVGGRRRLPHAAPASSA